MEYLVLWKVTNKYDYIFRSSEIEDIKGAIIILDKLEKDFSNFDLKDENFILKNNGYFLYKFKDLNQAKKFTNEFSFSVAKNFDGIDICMVTHEFDGDKSQKLQIDELFEKIQKKENEAKNSCHQISFGIEKLCNKTGMPINEIDSKCDSKEIRIKKEMARNYKANFNDIFGVYKDIKSIKDVVSDSGKNYVGIINVELEGFKTFIENNLKTSQRYIKELKNLDNEYKNLEQEAIKKLIDKVNKKTMKKILPITIDANNIVFVCRGDVAIDVSKNLISEIEKFSKCFAGVCIIKPNSSFSQAYIMAKELSANAKDFSIKTDKNSSAIDFHIAQGEISNSLSYLRERDYSIGRNTEILNMRPLLIKTNKTWRTYDNFVQSFNNMSRAIKDKESGRGKIKELRVQIKKGIDTTEHFSRFYKIDKHLKSLNGTQGEYLFNKKDGRCMYLDAIEVIDLFVKLDD